MGEAAGLSTESLGLSGSRDPEIFQIDAIEFAFDLPFGRRAGESASAARDLGLAWHATARHAWLAACPEHHTAGEHLSMTISAVFVPEHLNSNTCTSAVSNCSGTGVVWRAERAVIMAVSHLDELCNSG